MQLRQILMRLRKTYKGKAKVREILERKKRKLQELDYDILKYAYIDKFAVENICSKLGFSESRYHNMLNVALGKLEALLEDREFKELVETM